MDLTASIAPKSDQLNADDLMAGPRTVTIEEVRAGTTEQPVEVHLVEMPGRPFKPSKSMRRVMVAVWGVEASEYVGRRLTLYRDPDVKFGGIVLGGIKISHLSHMDKRTSLALTASKGKRAAHVVEPLPEAAPVFATAPTFEEVAACTNVDELKAMWRSADPERRAQIEARVAELGATEAEA